MKDLILFFLGKVYLEDLSDSEEEAQNCDPTTLKQDIKKRLGS